MAGLCFSAAARLDLHVQHKCGNRSKVISDDVSHRSGSQVVFVHEHIFNHAPNAEVVSGVFTALP